MSRILEKDPDALLDYGRDWSDWLALIGDTLVASTWRVSPGEAGLNLSGQSFEITGKTVVWISGGATGETYEVTNRITTAGGRTDERTLTIKVTER